MISYLYFFKWIEIITTIYSLPCLTSLLSRHSPSSQLSCLKVRLKTSSWKFLWCLWKIKGSKRLCGSCLPKLNEENWGIRSLIPKAENSGIGTTNWNWKIGICWRPMLIWNLTYFSFRRQTRSLSYAEAGVPTTKNWRRKTTCSNQSWREHKRRKYNTRKNRKNYNFNCQCWATTWWK